MKQMKQMKSIAYRRYAILLAALCYILVASIASATEVHGRTHEALKGLCVTRVQQALGISSHPKVPQHIRMGAEKAINRGLSASARTIETAQQVFARIDRLRLPLDVGWASELAAKQLPRIVHFLERDAPIDFLLPAFPCKSENTQKKTLGHLPDLGEELSLRRLQWLIDSVGEIWSPGAKLVVGADGYAFADAFEIPHDKIGEYSVGLRRLITSGRMEVVDLMDFFPGAGAETAVGKLLERAPSEERVRSGFKEGIFDGRNPKELSTYYANLALFIENDTMRTFPSGKQRKKWARQQAMLALRQNTAYNELLYETYPHHIRFSVHPQRQSNEKIAIELVPGPPGQHNPTPWHNVTVFDQDDGQFRLMPRNLAEQNGFELIHFQGRPYFFLGRPQSISISGASLPSNDASTIGSIGVFADKMAKPVW